MDWKTAKEVAACVEKGSGERAHFDRAEENRQRARIEDRGTLITVNRSRRHAARFDDRRKSFTRSLATGGYSVIFIVRLRRLQRTLPLFSLPSLLYLSFARETNVTWRVRGAPGNVLHSANMMLDLFAICKYA